jgi:ABC-type hemin transport system ATPase subunit
VDRGRVAAEGAPDAVLESAAAEAAFGVRIRGVAAGDGAPKLWRFEPLP